MPAVPFIEALSLWLVGGCVLAGSHVVFSLFMSVP